MSGLIKFSCPDDKWGRPRFIKCLPKKGDIWGFLAPIKGTPWGKLINVVPGHIVAHAVRGYATPLMQMLGPDPRSCLRLISDESNRCALTKSCVAVGEHCYPCEKVPDCFEVPSDDLSFSLVASTVTLAWKDGYSILVIEGDELVI